MTDIDTEAVQRLAKDNTPLDRRYDGPDYAEWIDQVNARAADLLLTIKSLAYARPALLYTVTRLIEAAVSALDERKK